MVSWLYPRRDALRKTTLPWPRLSPPAHFDLGRTWHPHSRRVLRHHYAPIAGLHPCTAVPEAEAILPIIPECESVSYRLLNEDPGELVFGLSHDPDGVNLIFV